MQGCAQWRFAAWCLALGLGAHAPASAETSARFIDGAALDIAPRQLERPL